MTETTVTVTASPSTVTVTAMPTTTDTVTTTVPVTDTMTTVTTIATVTNTTTTATTLADTVTTTATATVINTATTTTTLAQTVTSTATATTTVQATTTATTTLVGTLVPTVTTTATAAVTETTTVVNPGPTVTATLVQTSVVTQIQPTTVTVVAPTTITAPPATIAAANLVLDSGVQLAGPGTFQITGSVEPQSSVVQIEFYDRVRGHIRDLGAAALNMDGTFTFTDHVKGTQAFITAVATDTSGQTTTTDASFNLTAGQAGPRQTFYDPTTGAYLGETVFYRDGAPKLTTSVGPDGSPLVTSHFTRDGVQITEIQAPGQTVTAAGPSLFENHHEANTNFVFDPGHGSSRIKDFRAVGAFHDTLDLPAADFQSIADVLHHTKAAPDGAEIHDPVTGDTIKLDGVDKAVLKTNPDVIKFHD